MCRFKKFFSGWLCVIIFCLSLLGSFCPYNTVYASGGASGILGYIFSSIGLVNTLTDGSISAVGGDLKSRCLDYVQENLNNGTGIYENSNGEYVFTNDFTQGIFNILQANGSSDVRVIGRNTSLNSVNSGYYTSALTNAIVSARDSYDSSLLLTGQFSSGSTIYTSCCVCDMSNVAYLNFRNYDNNKSCVYFYGRDFNSLTIDMMTMYQSYNSSSDSFSTVTTREGRGFRPSAYSPSSGASSFFFSPAEIAFNTYPSSNGTYLADYSLSGFNAVCTNSYVIAKSSVAFNSYSSFTHGVVCVNRSNISNISKEVINNNDWESIYNTTVQNIVNNYNNDNNKVIPEGDTFDYDTLRRYMDQFSFSVVEAVESGTNDIEGLIYDTNNWLNLIYNRIGSIYDLLASLDLSGGDSSVNSGSVGGVNSCNWSNEDIAFIKQHLSSLENSLIDYTPKIDDIIVKLNNLNTYEANNFHQLELLYSLLGDVYEAIQSGYSPSNPPPASYLPNVFDYLDNLPDADILDYIDDMDIIVDSMKNVVPFCFLGAGVVALTSLAHDPVAPSANIPFKFTSASTNTSFNEGFTIDISIFDSVHTVLITCECIGFMVLLGFLTVKVLYYLMGIL